MKLKSLNVLFFIGYLIVLILLSCGGGFDSDSEGADNLKDAVFGPDSTRQ